ncbi:hypothetical protein HanRHA438_Chr17g0838731 [Helianthus annuus]|nr:hypothetical protein HanIR_Chr17g0899461 [Helianthus annuus]KAJ0828571.1 hypothetical protein HanRHA438_Chr17g0838731 [Helianthus annuus]
MLIGLVIQMTIGRVLLSIWVPTLSSGPHENRIPFLHHLESYNTTWLEALRKEFAGWTQQLFILSGVIISKRLILLPIEYFML